MSSKTRPHARRGAAALLGASLIASGLVALPTAAVAAPDGSGLVISEVYGGGGNSGATLTHDFVELFNPTDEAVDLAELRLEYKSAAGGSGGALDLDGVVEPGGHFLVQLAQGSGGSQALPAPDQTGSLALSGSNGRVYLYEGTGQFDGAEGDIAGAEGLVDMVGYGSAVSFEGAATPSLSNTTSASRAEGGADTDDNSADFAVGAPAPTNAAGEGDAPGEPEPTPDPTDEPVVEATIAEVQGTGDASEMQGQTVVVEGVVTADWREGGFNGFTMQDPAGDPTDGASDAIFAWGDSARAEIGESVRVSGEVSEYDGLTEITVDDIVVLDEDLGDVEPLTDWEAVATDEGKHAHQSELVHVEAPFTVTDNYDANFYGSFGLAVGEETLRQPTADIDPHDVQAIEQAQRENAAKSITLDDARSTNFSSRTDVPLSYLTTDSPVRVGAQVAFEQPFVLDYRYGGWALQPTTPISGDGSDVVTFSDERVENAAPADVGGDLTLATFNVLNYFPTTAEEFVAEGLGTCTTYDDREGTPIGANRCEPNGPRGAATAESFERQETKIVNAISGTGASVVSLEEIENSSHYGKDRDVAVETLVAALNEKDGEGVWSYAASPEGVPSDEDVIRNAFIFRTADVELVGASHILTGDPAFHNAREPLFQGFKAAGADDDDAFLVSANHFKSKGSGTDDGTGQGNANPDRVAQAEALVEYSAEVQELTDIDSVFLAGDFNAYAAEDPARAIEAGGFTNLNYALNGGEATYNYDGQDGSLDHVFANESAMDLVTGVDVWQINAQEQVGYEYSRYNYNATLLYDESVFRASDHNPILVGIEAPETEQPAAEWTRGDVYTDGDIVSHKGATYVAQWWTTEKPGTTPWGSWMEQGEIVACEQGDIASWTRSQVYEGGEHVTRGGEVFEAQWWTRNQNPAGKHGPWESLGAC
ncbi:ExeM/NucH family extracellular endonuclease [Microbacterium sp. G2-8]|uniref:ExeM/NucH family extracellular endonuclease n=1 Tax=Microbacterium sp. G2-8 TaxID=2842454 RepID=UPI001C8AF835|nr:ExeM/NucH family extracellular endonuclease [Microbacterium sp. G2-8]